MQSQVGIYGNAQSMLSHTRRTRGTVSWLSMGLTTTSTWLMLVLLPSCHIWEGYQHEPRDVTYHRQIDCLFNTWPGWQRRKYQRSAFLATSDRWIPSQGTKRFHIMMPKLRHGNRSCWFKEVLKDVPRHVHHRTNQSFSNWGLFATRCFPTFFPLVPVVNSYHSC